MGSQHRETAVSLPLLVVILGPTASGKTALSLALAQKFDGEIVNCDSVAMVREFDIGTAKPNAEERARSPHHLFDCIDPAEYMTAGEYARRARQVLREIDERRHLLLRGGRAGSGRGGPARASAARRGPDHLHRVLGRLDRAAAEKVHANDIPKLIRAIEVCLASRQKMSDLWQQGRDPLQGFRILRVGLDPDRAALYERINERAREMFEAGLVEETKALLQKYGPTTRSLESLGYKQAVQFLQGELNREQAIQSAQQAHRNYAKRQMTWFRREAEVTWLKGFGDDPQIQREALQRVADKYEN